MNINNWKIFATFSLISIFILLLPTRISIACGGYDEDYYDGYQFLSFTLAEHETEFSPYILTFEDFHLPDDETRDKQRLANLQEWSDFACETDQIEDIDRVIYTSNVVELETLRSASKKGRVPSRWAKNTFASGLIKNKCTETFDYLIFAKRCEPHAVAGSRWEDEPEFDSGIQELIDEGKRRLGRTDNHFLRLRYMYQIVRLAHYADDYSYALELYEDLDYKVDEVPSIINWWLLGHKAGCLKRLGRNVESAYLFSKVFRNAPSKREQVYRSFHIDDNDEWKACMKMCKSDEERTTLFAMRAMDKHSQRVEEMENIYHINPSSEHLTPLLVKEISSIEGTFVGAEFRRTSYPEKPDEIAKNSLLRLLDFVNKALDQEQIKDIATWTIAQGYLEYLSRDLVAANRSYINAEPLVKDHPLLSEQLELFQLVLKIHAYTEMNPKIEMELYDIMQDNKYFKTVESLPNFIFDRVAQLYKKQGDEGKAFLCNFHLEDLQHNPKPEEINDLIVLAEQDPKNRFEENMLEEKIGEDYLSELYEIKGTYHLSRYELPEALRAFERVSSARMDSEVYYPYLMKISDCVHCELEIDSNVVEVTKLKLTQQLLDYEYKAKTDMEKAALYYYRLGAAYYNMSYYGHEFDVLDYYRTSFSWGVSPSKMEEEIKKDHSWGGFGNREFTDVSKPLFFFNKARELATDDELAARATFMAAKCELAMFYQDEKSDYSYWGDKAPNLPQQYRTYYDLLIKKYSETELFEEAVEECKFFGMYVEKVMGG